MTRLRLPAVILLTGSGLSAFLTAPDDYAVYSAVLAGIPDRHERLLIADRTADAVDAESPDLICSDFDEKNRVRFAEIIRANRALHSAAVTLASGKFDVGRPYMLLTPKQADDWRRTRLQPRVPFAGQDGESGDSAHPESHLLELGNVFYSADKRLALVYISDSCGSLCGASQWHLLEKSNGQWRDLSVPACGSVY